MQFACQHHIEINECRKDKRERQLKEYFNGVLSGPIFSDDPELSQDKQHIDQKRTSS